MLKLDVSKTTKQNAVINCVECSTEVEREKMSGEPNISCMVDINKEVNERGITSTTSIFKPNVDLSPTCSITMCLCTCTCVYLCAAPRTLAPFADTKICQISNATPDLYQ